MRELKAKEEKRTEYIFKDITPEEEKKKVKRLHGEYEIRCGKCNNIMVQFRVFYEDIYTEINKVVLIDFRCPNCGVEYKEIYLS